MYKRQFGLPPAHCQLAVTGAVGHIDFTYKNLQKATLLATHRVMSVGPVLPRGAIDKIKTKYPQDLTNRAFSEGAKSINYA